MNDLTFALRQLLMNPAFTAGAPSASASVEACSVLNHSQDQG